MACNHFFNTVSAHHVANDHRHLQLRTEQLLSGPGWKVDLFQRRKHHRVERHHSGRSYT